MFVNLNIFIFNCTEWRSGKWVRNGLVRQQHLRNRRQVWALFFISIFGGRMLFFSLLFRTRCYLVHNSSNLKFRFIKCRLRTFRSNRRSSNMIETDAHSGQESKAGGVELFDLSKFFFVYSFYFFLHPFLFFNEARCIVRFFLPSCIPPLKFLTLILRNFFLFFSTASTQRYFWNSVYNFFLDPSESVEFTEFEPFHFRRVRLAAGITDAIYSMYVYFSFDCFLFFCSLLFSSCYFSIREWLDCLSVQ